MQNPLKLLCTIPLAAMVVLWAPLSIAAPVISEQSAISDVPSIKLKVQQGTNLKLPSGTKAYRGWLDNQSLADVTSDRPFNDGATIVVLTGKHPGQGHLSLVVRNESGAESLYMFKVVTGSESAGPLVEIEGVQYQDNSTPEQPFETQMIANRPPAEGDDIGLDAIRQGVEAAKRQGLLEGRPSLSKAIQALISQIEGGATVSQAAEETDLGLDVVRKLVRMGVDAPETPDLPVESAQEQPEVKEVKAEAKRQKKQRDKLESRIAGIEKQVKKLIAQVTGLEADKVAFLARLDKVDKRNQSLFASLENRLAEKEEPQQTAEVPQPQEQDAKEGDEPNTVVLSASALEKSKVTTPPEAEPPSEPKPVEASSPAESEEDSEPLSPVQYAHVIRRRLSTPEGKAAVPYSSYRHSDYRKVQNVIVRLNAGDELEKAAQRSGVQMSLLQQLGVE